MSHIATDTDITIRAAEAADAPRIARLAGRDTADTPAEPVLVAEVAGAMRAAISLQDGQVVADPFHRTAELVAMLRIRASATQMSRPDVLTFRRPRRQRLAFRTAA
jgi:hypothetical protein